MASNEADIYLNSPLFRDAMRYFQSGNWEAGLAQLNELEKKYPLASELRSLRQEMQIRARIDEYEIAEQKQGSQNRLKFWGSRIAIGILVVGAVFLAVSVYSSWLQSQFDTVRHGVEEQVLQAGLSVQFINAQQLVQAGKADEALVIFDAISAEDPNYPGLPEARAGAETLKRVEEEYAQALALLQANDSVSALEIFQAIQQQYPQYRDVALRIQQIESQVQYDDVIANADLAFSEGRYEDAISGYESVRVLDATFRTDYVNGHLYESYIAAAQAVLAEPDPSLDTLRQAENYFSQALTLRPQDRSALASRASVRAGIETRLVDAYIEAAQAALVDQSDSLTALAQAEEYFRLALEVSPDDPIVLRQFDLARVYLASIEQFNSGQYDAVISGLEYVVGEQADYAGGTGRQTLYEAYVGRGNENLASGDFDSALEDFQRAAILAQQIPEADSTYFEAQILIAETQGLLGEYEDAVRLYQAAIDRVDIRQRINDEGGDRAVSLRDADFYAGQGNFEPAFRLYRDVLRGRVATYDTGTVHVVKGGDYLTQLARQYHTTVNAILQANGLTNTTRITPDMQLIIPTLP